MNLVLKAPAILNNLSHVRENVHIPNILMSYDNKCGRKWVRNNNF